MPAAEVVTVIPGARRSGGGSKVVEIALRVPSSIFVIARHWVRDGLVGSPRMVISGLEPFEARIGILVVAECKYRIRVDGADYVGRCLHNA